MRRAAWGAVFAAGVAGFEVALFRLSDIGTCASGGPYVIGSECPEGTTAWVAVLIGSVIAMLAGGLGVGSIGPDRGPGDRGWLPVPVYRAVYGPLTYLMRYPGHETLANYGQWWLDLAYSHEFEDR